MGGGGLTSVEEEETKGDLSFFLSFFRFYQVINYFMAYLEEECLTGVGAECFFFPCPDDH